MFALVFFFFLAQFERGGKWTLSPFRHNSLCEWLHLCLLANEALPASLAVSFVFGLLSYEYCLICVYLTDWKADPPFKNVPVVLFSFFLIYLFYIGVHLINNVVIILGVQQSDSVYTYPCTYSFQIIFPFRLLRNIQQSSPCCPAGPCWFSMVNTAVCPCLSQTP